MIMPERRLRESDRAFFSLVTRAVFSNPFGDRRAELDRHMARSYAAAGGGPIFRVFSSISTLDWRRSMSAAGQC
jgi:hypothetical protein